MRTGATPCELAVQHGHAGTLALLLPAAPEAAIAAALHRACSDGYEAAVQAILAAAPDAALARQEGRLPIHAAAEAGHTSIIERLLAVAPGTASAVVERQGYSGGTRDTPLHLAAGKWQPEAVRVLLSAAPETAEACNLYGSTPLHAAVSRRGGVSGDQPGDPQAAAEVVSLLLTAAPQAARIGDPPDSLRDLPIHSAAQAGSVFALPALLAAALDTATAADEHSPRTPLLLAVEAGSVEAARILLQAAPDAALLGDNWGSLPVRAAACRNPAAALNGV